MKKQNNKHARWRLLLKIFANISGGLIFLYFIVCFTPFPNLLAKPLLVGNSPEKADAIVVLSGGAYPDGSLSWFSMERLLYGLRLFKEGYADKLILSGGKGSGSKSDAYDMMVFVKRLGFSQEIFILEEESQNTRENIKNVSQLMKEVGMGNALVVSSSVHMKRVSLLIEKNNNEGGPKMIPVAVPFYDSYRDVVSDRIVLFHYTLREVLILMVYKIKGFI